MTRRKSWLSALAAVLLLLASGVAQAQGVQTGVLNGTVVSSDGAPLPAVTVTITSPALIGERSMETGVNGDYNFRSLPPGAYTVSFTMEGMKTIERTATVTLGGTSRSDATLEPAAAAETITVTGESPSALETTSVGANLEKELVDSLPVARNPVAISDLAPGLNDNTPVGGQMTIHGAMAYDNAILINGINTQDPVFGGTDGLFIEEAIEETQVLTSGISAEYGGFTGGVINTITKSGGNTFKGTFRTDVTKPEWRDETPFEKSRGTERTGDLNKDYSATLGGPIMRDRAWFFLAGREFDENRPASLQESGIPFTRERSTPRYEVKLTGNLNQSNTLQVGYVSNNTSETPNVQLRPMELAALIPNAEFPNDGLSASYTGVFTDNLMGELRYSEKAFQFKGLGGTGSDLRNDSPFYAYGYITGVSGLFGAPYFDATDPESRDNEEITASLSYFLTTERAGSHDLKAGYDDFTVKRTGGNSQSPTNYVFATDPLLGENGELVYGPDGRLVPVWEPDLSFIQLYLPTRGAELDIQTRSLFVNDRWQLGSRWSFSLGARYEKIDSEATGNIVGVDTSTFTPRLGVAWDPKGDGSWKVDATYAEYSGRYNPSIFGDNTAVANPLAIYSNYIGPPGVGRDFDPAFDFNNYVPFAAVDSRSNVFFADGISSAKVTEYTVSVGHALQRGGFAKLSYIDRVSDQFLDDFITLDQGCSQVVVEGLDIGCFDNIVYRNTSAPFRDYQGLELQAEYRLTDVWTLAGNVTYQLKNEGNYEGEGTQQIGTSLYGNRPEVYPQNRVEPVGRFDDYQEYKVRLWTNYNLDFGRAGHLGLGALFAYDSGLPFSYTGSSAATPQQRALNPGYQQLPNFTYFFGERGVGEYDGSYTLSLALNYDIPIWKTVAPWIKLDVRNLLNYDEPTGWNVSVRPTPGGPVDQFGIPTTFVKASTFGNPRNNLDFVTPREYRFAVGVRF